jgi:alpha-mannosidase
VIKLLVLLIINLLVCITLANAKEVNLFDQHRGETKKETKKVVTKKNKRKAINKELIAIQRISNKYTLLFKGAKGKQERYTWNPKAKEKVEIKAGYSIEAIEKHFVILKLDSGLTCQADKKKNSSCLKPDLLKLTLKRNQSIKPKKLSKEAQAQKERYAKKRKRSAAKNIKKPNPFSLLNRK